MVLAETRGSSAARGACPRRARRLCNRSIVDADGTRRAPFRRARGRARRVGLFERLVGAREPPRRDIASQCLHGNHNALLTRGASACNAQAAGSDDGHRRRESNGWMSCAGTSIVLVVFNHAILFANSSTGSPPLAWALNEVFAPIRMPLMVFLSGLLVAPSLARGRAALHARKAAARAVPVLVWSAIALAAACGLGTCAMAWSAAPIRRETRSPGSGGRRFSCCSPPSSTCGSSTTCSSSM